MNPDEPVTRAIMKKSVRVEQAKARSKVEADYLARHPGNPDDAPPRSLDFPVLGPLAQVVRAVDS